MTREIHTQRGRHHTHAFFLSPRHLLRVLVFLCICRSDIWVPRSVSMYTPIDDDTFIASRRPRPPRGPFGSPLARSSSSHTRARERTRRANERTHARTRAGIFFFSLRYRHVDAHRYASRARSRPRARSRIRAGTRCGCSGTRATATRETRRRAKAREEYSGFFWVAFARAVVARSSRGRRRSRARGRRRAVDRTSTERRPGDTSRVSV